MTSTVAETVTCMECRQENEIERIYCHHCGARLERRKVTKAPVAEEDTQKRVKQLFDPTRARIRAIFFRISKITLGACVSAVFILMATPPEVPAPPKGLIQARAINFDIEHVVSRHQPVQMKYSEDEVNSFIAYDLKNRRKQLDEPLLEFKRAAVAFHEGSCAVTMERAFFGYSLFTTLDLAPVSGKAAVVSKGASIGRLPIHPEVAHFMNYLFADLSQALDRERKLVLKLSGIEFHDKAVVLTSGS